MNKRLGVHATIIPSTKACNVVIEHPPGLPL